MPDTNLFDTNKLSLAKFNMVKGEVDEPDGFKKDCVVGHGVETSLAFGFNLEDKLVKVDFKVKIKTDSQGENKSEATGYFHFVYIYQVENLQGFTVQDKDNIIELNPTLGNALSSITYSTSRGILLTRLQGTVLKHFILPIINPNELLHD